MKILSEPEAGKQATLATVYARLGEEFCKAFPETLGVEVDDDPIFAQIFGALRDAELLGSMTSQNVSEFGAAYRNHCKTLLFCRMERWVYDIERHIHESLSVWDGEKPCSIRAKVCYDKDQDRVRLVDITDDQQREFTISADVRYTFQTRVSTVLNASWTLEAQATVSTLYAGDHKPTLDECSDLIVCKAIKFGTELSNSRMDGAAFKYSLLGPIACCEVNQC